jgi:hypothetical protein
MKDAQPTWLQDVRSVEQIGAGQLHGLLGATGLPGVAPRREALEDLAVGQRQEPADLEGGGVGEVLDHRPVDGEGAEELAGAYANRIR